MLQGRVYAVNGSALYVEGFSYDGTGEDAQFFAGQSDRPGEEAVLLLPEVNSRELTALADLLYHGRLVPQRSIIFNNCF